MKTMDETILTQAVEIITAMKKPLLVTHTKPDGDAIGSLVAMRSILKAIDIQAQPVVFDPIPDRYVFMVKDNSIPLLGQDLQLDDLTTFDGVVILDTCSYGQIAPISDWYRSAEIPKIVVDHHVTRDAQADVHLIDEKAAATSLILYEWAVDAGWEIDHEAAGALYVGIATDTGWFRHSNTDRRVMSAAGELIQRGVKPYEIHEHLYQHESLGRFRLRAAVMSQLELLADDRLAITTLPNDLFTKCGATLADTEDLVNEPLRISSVLVSVMLVEQDDGQIRAGFRSKPPPDADSPDVDVAAIAQHFGGGGHRRAAGARVEDNLRSVKEKIVDHIRPKFD